MDSLLLLAGRPGAEPTRADLRSLTAGVDGVNSWLLRDPSYGASERARVPMDAFGAVLELTDPEALDAVAERLRQDLDWLDRGRSTAVRGRWHHLRPGNPAPLRLFVTARGPAGSRAADVHRDWMQVGRFNAAHHPSCSDYVQVHVDERASARLSRDLEWRSQPVRCVAIESFPDDEAMEVGRRFANSPARGTFTHTAAAGEPELTLNQRLDRCLDFSTAEAVLTVPA